MFSVYLWYISAAVYVTMGLASPSKWTGGCVETTATATVRLL